MLRNTILDFIGDTLVALMLLCILLAMGFAAAYGVTRFNTPADPVPVRHYPDRTCYYITEIQDWKCYAPQDR